MGIARQDLCPLSSLPTRWLLYFYLIFWVPIFFIFTYNSGYGYDALEYLTISKLLVKNFDLYAIIPSKSWGMYAYTNLAFRIMAGEYNHITVSALILFNVLLMVFLTYYVVSNILSPFAGLIAAIIVSHCCVFMEMNYLEPEILVGVCGMAGYWIIARQRQHYDLSLFIGGLCIGLGMWFKVIAAFYFLGICFFLAYVYLRKKLKPSRLFKSLSIVSVGFLLPQILAALAFSITGRFYDHVEWTYLFPLRGYPSNIYWLSKFFMKLLWFHSLLVYCLILSVRKINLRTQIYSDHVILALLLACFSLLSLIKTQATHYFFPSAIFFCIFMAVVLEKKYGYYLAQLTFKKIAVLVLMVCATLLCAQLYRPDALARLYRFNDYQDEVMQATLINMHVPEDSHLLAIDGAPLLYFISNRYPNVPFINTDVQTTYYLSKYPSVLKEALEDDNLAMVIFNDQQWSFDDPILINNPNAQSAIKLFELKLKQLYYPVSDSTFRYKIWLRKKGSLGISVKCPNIIWSQDPTKFRGQNDGTLDRAIVEHPRY